MFLSMLNEESKKEFLELCIYASNANGVFEESERSMILEYCSEMKISVPEMKCSKSTDEIFENIKNNCSETEKRIIALELLGLLYADNEFDYKEKDFLERYVNVVGVSEEIVDEIKQLFMKYLDLYKRMLNIIKCD